jgi:hypothetical protein
MIAVFHNKVDLILTNMKTIGGKNVWVLAVKVYFYFVDKVLQFDFVFAESFDSD